MKNAGRARVQGPQINGQLYEQIANLCPNLKQLHVYNEGTPVDAIDRLFTLYYPSLEYLHIVSKDINSLESNDVMQFLEKHSKLKHFECEYQLLWTIIQSYTIVSSIFGLPNNASCT